MWFKIKDFLYGFNNELRIIYCIQLGDGRWYPAFENIHNPDFLKLGIDCIGYDTLEECQNSFKE